ncbi:hypothetical protein KSP40_PGU010137 [Platanthera guangdongensis]|uniref:Uncharacterized protein n=1 Tax=Platanthera guangdongensis TaxID=2320717 RepID=A0ABR2LLX9_9ASPA
MAKNLGFLKLKTLVSTIHLRHFARYFLALTDLIPSLPAPPLLGRNLLFLRFATSSLNHVVHRRRFRFRLLPLSTRVSTSDYWHPATADTHQGTPDPPQPQHPCVPCPFRKLSADPVLAAPFGRKNVGFGCTWPRFPGPSPDLAAPGPSSTNLHQIRLLLAPLRQANRKSRQRRSRVDLVSLAVLAYLSRRKKGESTQISRTRPFRIALGERVRGTENLGRGEYTRRPRPSSAYFPSLTHQKLRMLSRQVPLMRASRICEFNTDANTMLTRE